ncbi:hypothetical protein RXV86_12030 [Alisedimentitalea sp. MJ-SS2]|uniref:hypothetical protein n=1 Tax=Aliisedimentitalea sp. MJ-SS2 TaxID=3049795 RepID=UPI00290B4BED|nr:hypothetical protein [Alisedimentitalea sp. MJ-SS2]MDU8928116.1 hypothetical protein [Alisedimentitalea sp. MJ-SS2]
MAFPLLAVVAALKSGGHLVAHSAGGLIVYSASTGGYVAGTYISTAGLASFLTGTVTAAKLGVAVIGGSVVWAYGTTAGAFSLLVGGPGIFGTTVGATGVTGLLMSWGFLPAVPIVVPLAIGILVMLFVAAALRAYSVRRLRKKTMSTPQGTEANFSAREAKLVEKLLRNISKPHSWLWKKWMAFWGWLSRLFWTRGQRPDSPYT